MPARGQRRPLSVAPMMDHTDRHLRWVLRQLSRHTLLYTEMVVGQAIRYGDREKLLGFDPVERPVALQLGGDDPALLAQCARIAEDMGYDEVNLNVGCPSDRVQSGSFGAVLMKTPHKVAEGVHAMRAQVSIPVTVKHRIGVDDLDSYEQLERFVDVVAEAGCDRFVVHARIAILAGLSPKQNREVPPLRYDDVVRLKRARPALWIELNGGVTTLEAAVGHLDAVDGVMIGRAVIEQPMMLARADAVVFGVEQPSVDAEGLVEAVESYVRRPHPTGFRPWHVHRHLMGLFTGVPGARAWRRTLAQHADAPDATRRALAAVRGR
ncbi:MAG: tRNA dihydrouridine(20/20a) synthase DusA [Myxococcota bacterium]